MRQWHMLRLVPRHPAKRDTSEIKARLADEGFEVTPRTIQRDLMAFSSVFPLACDDRSKPFGWSWMADGNVMDIPGMDSHTALAFFLADRYLEPMLPRETIHHLQPHFDKAGQVLDAIPTDSGAPSWRDKVRVLRRGQFLSAPVVARDVQNEIYDALLLNRRVRFTYKARHHGESKAYEVSPLGLVLKDAVIYLICTCWDYTDIRLMTLHRMSDAIKTDIPVTLPDGFSLDAYIASGGLDFAEGGEINLKARVDADVAYHLGERPLHPDQRLVELDGGEWLLEASVQDTGELRWWLLGFGDRIEVVEPEPLRQDFSAIAKSMAAKYGNTP
ncbi:WYL domain-containing protein [Mariprofundus erugo]|uniref:helix-turn-helix transcriptional regulator n=1 Tax=Mariprofundus erugo TaxID=2528639 RepID=UPI0010FE7FEB|nr:WYL domain-containing protein [Mariprofundus erugo]TLS75121.1 WYL domain-containing protein [Mariprofundus erugo]